jgi:hypothetical protein
VHPRHNDIRDDGLSTVEAIAAYIHESPRRTNYLLATKKIPGWKIGAIWYSSKSKLRARFLGEDGAI